MFAKHWPILIVDDDPDVLAISALAMRSFEIDGIPLKIYSASSQAEAVALLTSQLAAQSGTTLAVAFVDVVMETDDAGLQLCEYIRSTLKNRLTQIYVRTGQPGRAPERTVIDRYDINGYFTKYEATEDKLYSLVKAGVRQYEFTRDALGLFQLLGAVVAQADSVAAIGNAMTRSLERIIVTAEGKPRPEAVQISCAAFIGDQLITNVGISASDAWDTRARLSAHSGRPLDSLSGKAVIDGTALLIHLDASASGEEAALLMRTVASPGDTYVALFAAFLATIATVAKRAGSREMVEVR